MLARNSTEAGLSTPRSTLRTGYCRVLVWCKACRHQADADLQAIIDSGVLRPANRTGLMAVVISTYRYKPPNRKGRKLAEITGPRIVTSVPVKKSRRPREVTSVKQV